MPAANEITDEEIAYAEAILLPPGKSFDAERRAFIRRLDTLDLQAVPGSGKTTTLLAKLLILERRLPFADGAGVLVLSHTNAALDEIGEKIAHFCPRLFAYPNFVGTIQSFVDHFFAIPYYCTRNGKRPARIHNDRYDERAEALQKLNRAGFTAGENNRAKYFLNANRCAASIRFALHDDKPVLVDRINGTPIKVTKPNHKGQDWTDPEKNRVLAWLDGFKKQLMKEGALCFDDAYFLADRYLSVFPGLINLLRRRFRHIFVDEMQDMGRHQHDLLEKLFCVPAHDQCAYQRIGDRNQGIHNERDVGDESQWVERQPTLTLNNSVRLSPEIAAVVSTFALHNPGLKINGINASSTKPTMIVYNDATAKSVLQKFSAIVRAEIDATKIPLTSNSRFRAIAWNTTWENEDEKKPGKLRLIDFYSGFTRITPSGRTEFRYLDECVRECNRPGATMRVREAGLLAAFLKALRLENVKNPVFATHFTRVTLMAHLRDTVPDYYAELRRLLFRWCLSAANGGMDGVVQGVREHFPIFLGKFACPGKASKAFVETVVAPAAVVPAPAPKNTINLHGFDIVIASVHAVKGQNHTATLYFESAYYADGKGAAAKSYESQRLADQFAGKALAGNEGSRVKQSAKMVYVGFSRPTHLLCFAVHKDRFEAHLKGVAGLSWNVVELA